MNDDELNGLDYLNRVLKNLLKLSCRKSSSSSFISPFLIQYSDSGLLGVTSTFSSTSNAIDGLKFGPFDDKDLATAKAMTKFELLSVLESTSCASRHLVSCPSSSSSSKSYEEGEMAQVDAVSLNQVKGVLSSKLKDWNVTTVGLGDLKHVPRRSEVQEALRKNSK